MRFLTSACFQGEVEYLTQCRSKEQDGTTIYPWLHSFCNLLKSEDQLKGCSFPDELPSLPPGSDFSMSAGDFLEVYTEPSK